MSRNRSSSITKTLLAGVVILAAAIFGVYVGTATRGVVDQPDLSEIFPNLTLATGTDFPSVELINEDNLPVNSTDLIGSEGTIVLFMDLGCPPCEQLTAKFQTLINDGKIPQNRIIGICPTTPVDYLSGFYNTYGVTFPVFADTASTFRHEFGVEGYPILLAVGADKKIRTVAGDARMNIDTDLISSWLAD